ncbi:ATP-binding protein [Endozoicomonas sp. SCSIO W0465]|uniref:AAA family ATPase n=1 Tax=Endozoicomonas sp. SCSIO W0465 TaxID=2918516 RepID=UPI002074D134|nr:ATP-binding protein [Endozoicomonas sp. SCSIO W0465]USE39002.1 ATP-binding protein [Endozoicomonas sp. SCSIO W0465]
MITGNDANSSRYSAPIDHDNVKTGSGTQNMAGSSFERRSVRTPSDSVRQYMQDRGALLGKPQSHLSEYSPGLRGDHFWNPGSIRLLDKLKIEPNSGIEAETSSRETNGNQFTIEKYRNEWLAGSEPNSVVVAAGTLFDCPYACLHGKEGFTQTVKVLKRDDVESQTAYLTQIMRRNCKLTSAELTIHLTPGIVAAERWDSVALHIQRFQPAKNDSQASCEPEVLTESWHAIADAFLRMCRQSGCPLEDLRSYVFNTGDHCFVASVKLSSTGDAPESSVGLLAGDARVTRITVSAGVKKKLNITGTPAAIDVKKLAKKFDFNGEAYGIGGANGAIRQFVDAFISPRLVPGKLQNTMKGHLSRGGILSGPPGTGKTLFIRVIESLLKENGFSVSTQIISGPEVFNKYVGESEQRVRAIFSDSGAEDQQVIRLVLIDEIDSMLPTRGRVGDNGIGDKVVNQFLTCMDGVDKKNNLIVFGTTNRPDLVDPAVMRPGRMDMQMVFNLPEITQRLQILKIQTRDLSDSGMLNADVSLDELASNTAGFSGAELGALVEKARLSALRRGQGLAEGNTFFSPQALSHLETLDVSMVDFNRAFTRIKPQFGKSNFMSLAGKTFDYVGYSPEVVSQLRKTLADFKRDDSRSSLRILIKGPQGSGKSTLAALANHEFGSICSYVSASDVVKSRDSNKTLNDVFAEQRNHQICPDSNHAVIIDDFDTMIRYYDDVTYDRGMVAVLDAHTKQSLQGQEEGKLLTIVTATEHEQGRADFLPRLFPDNLVFKTMGRGRM